MIDLDELMRRHDAATPGPWSVKIGDFEAASFDDFAIGFKERFKGHIPPLFAHLHQSALIH